MNNLAKKLITLVVIATVAFYAFASFRNTYNLKRQDQCQGELEFCFSECRTYEVCEQLQKQNDAVMMVADCPAGLHMCGDGRCYKAWCPY